MREALGQPQGHFLRARPLWAELGGAGARWGWLHNVRVSGRPDIEVRLDLPGQLLDSARLFGRSASRHARRCDKGTLPDLAREWAGLDWF